MPSDSAPDPVLAALHTTGLAAAYLTYVQFFSANHQLVEAFKS